MSCAGKASYCAAAGGNAQEHIDAAQTFFGDFTTVGGPESSVFLDYRHDLPLKQELRLRVDLVRRESETDNAKRFLQRVRLADQFQLTSRLSATVEFQYRRADYPESAGGGLPERLDDNISVEARMDMRLRRSTYLNWGYIFEHQDSTRADQKFKHHQFALGLTWTY